MNTTLTNSTVFHVVLMEWFFAMSPIFNIALHTFNVLLCLPLNIYIIYILFAHHGALDPSDIFSLNQALAEIFYVLLAPFHGLCSISMKLCFFKPLGFFLGVSLVSRIEFQFCVSLERYLAVVHPVTFLRYKPARYRVACSIAAWVCALTAGILCAWMFPFLPYFVSSFFYSIILIVETYCCISILKNLRHPGPRRRQSEEVEISAAKRKAFQVVFFNLVLFLMQNGPYAVLCGLYYTVSLQDFGLGIMIAMAVNAATAFFQPAFILHKAGKVSGVFCPVKRI